MLIIYNQVVNFKYVEAQILALQKELKDVHEAEDEETSKVKLLSGQLKRARRKMQNIEMNIRLMLELNHSMDTGARQLQEIKIWRENLDVLRSLQGESTFRLKSVTAPLPDLEASAVRVAAQKKPQKRVVSVNDVHERTKAQLRYYREAVSGTESRAGERPCSSNGL